jgi:hypothetical protein
VPALLADKTAGAAPNTPADRSTLVIQEFDLWSNPLSPMFSPTTICLCRQDPTEE